MAQFNWSSFPGLDGVLGDFDQLKKSLMSSSSHLFSPQIVDDGKLPISEFKDDFIREFLNNQAIVVSGATGSGKSTQV